MLKELLLRDFGKDLKISGGAGNSVDDPIIIEVETAQKDVIAIARALSEEGRVNMERGKSANAFL